VQQREPPFIPIRASLQWRRLKLNPDVGAALLKSTSFKSIELAIAATAAVLG